MRVLAPVLPLPNQGGRDGGTCRWCLNRHTVGGVVLERLKQCNDGLVYLLFWVALDFII